MAEPTPIHAPLLLSISSLANALGCARETVRRRLHAAGVQPAGKRGGHPVYALRQVVDAWMAGAEEQVDPDKLDPFQRRAYYQGDLDKLKLQVERSELIPRAEVERELARVFQLVAHCFDTLPDILERDCGAPPRMLTTLEAQLDGAREELYRVLIEDPERVSEALAEG